MLKIRRHAGKIVVEDLTNVWRFDDARAAIAHVRALLEAPPRVGVSGRLDPK